MSHLNDDICLESDWWKQRPVDEAVALLDRHVGGSGESLHLTGFADFNRGRELTNLPASEGAVLEIGCGAGRMSPALATHYGYVVGVDVSPELIRLARRTCPPPNVEFHTLSGDSLQIPFTQPFEAAFSYEVFHYLPEKVVGQYMQEIHDLLQPNGVFLLQLNTAPLQWTTRLALVCRRGLHSSGVGYWRGWPTAPAFNRKPHSANSISEMLADSGFSLQSVVQPDSKDTWILASKHRPSESR